MLYRNILNDTGKPFGDEFEAATLEQARLMSNQAMNAAQNDHAEILTYYTQCFVEGRWVTAIA